MTYRKWYGVVTGVPSQWKEFAKLSLIISLKIQSSPSILRHHMVLFICTFMCLIRRTKLTVMWESLFSHGLTTSKVNVSSAAPSGSNEWEARGKAKEEMKEGHRIPSWFHLNPSCVSPPGPSGPATWGSEGGPWRSKGGREWGWSERGGREWTGPYSLPRGSVVLISVRISNLDILSS